RAGYASGITPTVRVETDPVRILPVLEQGVMGLTVPDVESAEAARAVVQAARYPPRGRREISRPLRYIGEPSEAYFRWADDELVVSVQIETRAGLDALDEIVAVDGLDMVQSGRQDLALSLGVPGQPSHPRVLEAEERIVQAAWKAGKWVSLHFPPAPDSLDRARAYSAAPSASPSAATSRSCSRRSASGWRPSGPPKQLVEAAGSFAVAADRQAPGPLQ